MPLSRFVSAPVIHTLHHPWEPELSALYGRYPDVWYVAISDAQRRLEQMPRLRTIHHGVCLKDYRVNDQKQGYGGAGAPSLICFREPIELITLLRRWLAVAHLYTPFVLRCFTSAQRGAGTAARHAGFRDPDPGARVRR